MIQILQPLMPFIVVAYSMWATPGPNNMMLTYSGARFGMEATIPHLSGIIFGTCILNLLAILGLKPLITQWPQLLMLLKIVGSIWLVIIGWKMAHASRAGSSSEEKPMAFMAAVLFQFANPKAISATLALVSLVLVALEQNPDLMWAVMLIIPPLSLISILPWAIAGRGIRRFLSTPLRWKVFTWLTGGLTAACAVFLWI
jgi:threonine/homoserine/homoserine lactone efflux protein